jgi:hypothetical protein
MALQSLQNVRKPASTTTSVITVAMASCRMVLHSPVWDSILNLAELAEPQLSEVGEVNSFPINYGVSFSLRAPMDSAGGVLRHA